MPLKLMYITNKPEDAKIAQDAGVDRIWIDLEVLGKEARQGHVDSVKSYHRIDDIAVIKPLITSSELIVRVNPINPDSKAEINKVINNGADIIMLPMFKTKKEVQTFLDIINGRTKTILLLETKEAEDNIDDILPLIGIDEMHIGLNDLHLAHNMKFMFELLADGTVEKLCIKIKARGIPFGFGGIAKLGQGILPAEHIIAEHYRLGSSMAILSRSFCNADRMSDSKELKKIFSVGVKQIRDYEKELRYKQADYYEENKLKVKEKVGIILKKIK